MKALSLSAHQTRRLRLRAQRLLPPAAGFFASPAEVVRQVVGVQAQDLAAARLSIRARSQGLTDAGVDGARQAGGTLLWTWAMRGTLHLLEAEEARWLLPLFWPGLIVAGQRRLRQLGWDEDHLAAGLKVLRQALEQRDRITRPELASLLEEKGLPSQGQAPVHLLYRAALEGLLCAGPDRERQTTYISLERWIGKMKPLPRPEALEKLARRYLAACGPAAPQDLASWSGLTASEAREAFELLGGQAARLEADGQPAWILNEQLAWLDEPGLSGAVVRLLPRYDTYLLSYASRDLAVAPAHARRVHPGGGVIHPVLLVDGQVQGVWTTRRRSKQLEIVVESFERLARVVFDQVEVEVMDMGRFLSEQTRLIVP